MKNLFYVIFILLMFSNEVFAENTTLNVYTEKNYFGLENEKQEHITKAEFKKLIKIGDYVWLVQKGSRYGLINNEGKYIVYPRYRHADRIFGKYAKLGNDNDYGLYDGYGNMIIPPMYSSIEILYNKLLLTCKNFKYGVINTDGKIILKNEFDDIYMPDFNTLRVLYDGDWYQFEKISENTDLTGKNIISINDNNLTITKLISNTGVGSGYVAVSLTDYIMKILSTLSPAYEKTVDDLMLSHGAETINIIKTPKWLVQFPFIYVKKYAIDYRAPNNGPLATIKQNLRRKLK